MNNLGIHYNDGELEIETDDVGVAEAIEDFLRMRGRALLIETIGWIVVITVGATGSVFMLMKLIVMFTEMRG